MRLAPVLTAALLVAETRALVVLAGPEWLVAGDEATWKHAAVALRQEAGGLDAEWLRQWWVHPFNFHQAAFVPWSLAFALVATVTGSGFLPLHLFTAAFAVVGAVAWVAWVDEALGAKAAWLAVLGLTLLPVPGLALGVRPWSGHAEGGAVAVLALWLASGGPGALRSGLAGLVAGAALCLSPLAAAVVGAGLLGRGLARAARPAWKPALAGLVVGLWPLPVRALLADQSFWRVPVQEDPRSTPAGLLVGQVGPGPGEALWPGLVFDPVNIPLAHSAVGLPAGDSLLLNGVLVAVGLVLLLIGLGTPRIRALPALSPEARALVLTVALIPVLTLVEVGLAGPVVALRYLAALYPAGAVSFAVLAGVGVAWSAAGRPRLGRGLVVAAVVAGGGWWISGGRGLIEVSDLSRTRWLPALDPGAWMVPMALEATPPLHLWADTRQVLAARRASACCATGQGLGLLFRPLDTTSPMGWQLRPPVDEAGLHRALDLAGEGRAHSVDEAVADQLLLRNLGAALHLAGGQRSWVEALDEPHQRCLLLAGMDERRALARGGSLTEGPVDCP